jgi:uncharacterized protein
MVQHILKSAILKISSICNINCAYCYMYNLSDGSHVNQPKKMSEKTIDCTFDWIGNYLNITDVASFHVSLHGGEPLIAGKNLINYILNRRNQVMNELGKEISMSLVSNGLLLDDEWLEMFSVNRIGLTISLDGPLNYHDKSRLKFNGAGTHSEVERNVKWLLSSPKGQSCFNGVLCVVHPEMNGTQLMQYFTDLKVPALDFLLPDQNYEYGCPGFPKPTNYPSYGIVLAEAYIEWRRTGCQVYVRKFVELLRATMGFEPTLDSLGRGPIQIFTVETSGEIEAVDSLKSCGESFTKSGLFIDNVSIDEIHNISLIKLGIDKGSRLSMECSGCRHKNSCGGGYLPHRFYKNTFENPSVYCSDLAYLCDIIVSDLSSIKSI